MRQVRSLLFASALLTAVAAVTFIACKKETSQDNLTAQEEEQASLATSESEAESEIKITVSNLKVRISFGAGKPKLALPSSNKSLFSKTALKFFILPLWLLKAISFVWASRQLLARQKAKLSNSRMAERFKAP